MNAGAALTAGPVHVRCFTVPSLLPSTPLPPQFSSMLFVPGMAPFDQDRQMGKSRNIRLYVKRVFISGEAAMVE